MNLIYPLTPNNLNKQAAQLTVEQTDLQQQDKETEQDFVLRIVCTYLNQCFEVNSKRK